MRQRAAQCKCSCQCRRRGLLKWWPKLSSLYFMCLRFVHRVGPEPTLHCSYSLSTLPSWPGFWPTLFFASPQCYQITRAFGCLEGALLYCHRICNVYAKLSKIKYHSAAKLKCFLLWALSSFCLVFQMAMMCTPYTHF